MLQVVPSEWRLRCAAGHPACLETSRLLIMIKLFSLKQEKEKEAASGSGGEKIAPGLIRMQKGVRARVVPRPATTSTASVPTCVCETLSLSPVRRVLTHLVSAVHRRERAQARAGHLDRLLQR